MLPIYSFHLQTRYLISQDEINIVSYLSQRIKFVHSFPHIFFWETSSPSSHILPPRSQVSEITQPIQVGSWSRSSPKKNTMFQVSNHLIERRKSSWDLLNKSLKSNRKLKVLWDSSIIGFWRILHMFYFSPSKGFKFKQNKTQVCEKSSEIHLCIHPRGFRTPTCHGLALRDLAVGDLKKKPAPSIPPIQWTPPLKPWKSKGSPQSPNTTSPGKPCFSKAFFLGRWWCFIIPYFGGWHWDTP